MKTKMKTLTKEQVINKLNELIGDGTYFLERDFSRGFTERGSGFVKREEYEEFISNFENAKFDVCEIAEYAKELKCLIWNEYNFDLEFRKEIDELDKLKDEEGEIADEDVIKLITSTLGFKPEAIRLSIEGFEFVFLLY